MNKLLRTIRLLAYTFLPINDLIQPQCLTEKEKYKSTQCSVTPDVLSINANFPLALALIPHVKLSNHLPSTANASVNS